MRHHRSHRMSGPESDDTEAVVEPVRTYLVVNWFQELLEWVGGS